MVASVGLWLPYVFRPALVHSLVAHPCQGRRPSRSSSCLGGCGVGKPSRRLEVSRVRQGVDARGQARVERFDELGVQRVVGIEGAGEVPTMDGPLSEGRFAGPDRQAKFLASFGFRCIPGSEMFGAARPAGPCAFCPMNDSRTKQPLGSNGRSDRPLF